MQVTEGLKIIREIAERRFCGGAGLSPNGQVCIEQAVSLAIGEVMTDAPDGETLCDPATYGRALNDSRWGSDSARTAALLPFGEAQVAIYLRGSTIDRVKFAELLVLRTAADILAPLMESIEQSEHAANLRSARTLLAVIWAAHAAGNAVDADLQAGGVNAAVDLDYLVGAMHATRDAASYAEKAKVSSATGAAGPAMSYLTSTANASSRAASHASLAVRSGEDSAASDAVLQTAARIVTESLLASELPSQNGNQK